MKVSTTRTRREETSTVSKTQLHVQSRTPNAACSNAFINNEYYPTITGGTIYSKVCSDVYPSIGYPPPPGRPATSKPFHIETITTDLKGAADDHKWYRTTTGCLAGHEVSRVEFVPENYSQYLLAPDLTDAERAVQWAVNAAHDRASQATMDALTALLEGKQTASMLKNLTLTLFGKAEHTLRTVAKTRRRNWQSRAGAGSALLADFNNMWLEARFGMRPLVHDIADTIEAIEDDYSSKDWFDGKAAQEFQLDTSKITHVPGAGTSPDYTYTSRLTGTATARGHVIKTMKMGRTSFGSNPIVTGYELFPFSFLIDKIYDVGSVLGSLSAVGANTVDSCGSIKVDYTSTVEIVRSYDGRIVSGYRHEGGSTHYVERRVQSYTRMPMSLGAPVYNNRLRTLDWVDIASIATSKLKLFERLAANLETSSRKRR